MMAARRADATGRSGTVIRLGAAKRWKLEGPWVGLTLDLMTSPGFRALSTPARRVLDFLSIEHMRHGGQENGRLLAPYEQLMRFGVSRRDIRSSFDELIAFGVVRQTTAGERLGGRPKASTYALTFYPTAGEVYPTEDFRRVTEADVATFLAERKRLSSLKRERKEARCSGR